LVVGALVRMTSGVRLTVDGAEGFAETVGDAVSAMEADEAVKM
jgi:hypothetical protein